MKRLLGMAALTAALILTFVACSGDDDSSSKADSSSSVSDSSSVIDSSSAEDSSSASDSSVEDSSSTEDSSQGGSFGITQKEESDITPAMWTATTKTGKTVYFLGSMHALSDDCYPLPDEVLNAYNSADALAVECDIVAYASDFEAQMNDIQQMLYLDGTSISDHIDADLYENMKQILEGVGIYNEAYDMYNEIMWTSLVQMAMMEDAGLDSELGIDNVLLKKAHNDGKKIIEIESVELQNAVLYGQPQELNMYMLEGSVYYYEDQIDLLKEMYEAWKSGDLEKLMELDSAELETEEDVEVELEEISPELQEMIDNYNKALMDDRNVGMIDTAIEMLEGDESIFYVVGAAHFGGETGLLKGLEDAGYALTPVIYD